MGQLTDTLLAIDTASPFCSVALWKNGLCLGHKTSEGSGEHFEQLARLVREVSEEASVPLSRLTRIGVGVGPGSFTGIRIGMSFAKGLAWSNSLPLSGFCSLAAVAAARSELHGTIGVVVDAGRSEAYAAVFQDSCQDSAILAPSIVSFSELGGVFSAVSAILTPQRSLLHEPSLLDSLPQGRPLQVVENVAVGGARLLENVALAAPWLQSVMSLEPSYLRQVAAKTIAERQAAIKP